MRYSVIWLPDAERELTDLWLNAPDRRAVTQASHAIDKRLENDPDTAGESRPNGRRIFFASPLGVTFRVDEATRQVQVLHVWRFGTSDS